jgi:hypothetical protein
MTFVTEEGLKVLLSKDVESDLARIVGRYIDRATSPEERMRRVKHVLALDGRIVLGLKRKDICEALGIRNHLRRALDSLAAELGAIAKERQEEDGGRQERFENSLEPLPDDSEW